MILLRLRKMHEDALRNTARVSEATIPAERIRGAILLISGERDRLWPATHMSEQIINRLKAKNFDHYYEHIVFSSGHNGIVMKKNSWRQIFAFLKEHFV